MGLLEILKKFQNNPDQLDHLAEAITLAETLEAEHTSLSSKVDDLQESNRKLLRMVNVPEPKEESKKEEEEPEKLTFESLVYTDE